MSLIILDGHYFLFRSYSIPFKFFSKKGIPLHVVSTFLKLVRTSVEIISSISDIDVRLAVIFDSNNKSKNFLIDEKYKANRKLDYSKDEDSPFKHYPFIRQVLDYLDIYNIEALNYEADDYIATLTSMECRRRQKVYIVSNDSDFFQLLGEYVFQIRLKRDMEYELIDKKLIEMKLGIDLKDYVFYKSLVGDPADNIKGIPKVGPEKASAIIRGELRYDLHSYSDLIKKNTKLITLNEKVPVDGKMNLSFDKEKLKMKNSDIFDVLKF